MELEYYLRNVNVALYMMRNHSETSEGRVDVSPYSTDSTGKNKMEREQNGIRETRLGNMIIIYGKDDTGLTRGAVNDRRGHRKGTGVVDLRN